MYLIDEKFKQNKLSYVLQSLLATLSVFIVLLVLGFVHNAVVVASLGASFFIIFTMPNHKVSTPRRLIGGYLVGILSAFICYNIFLFLSGVNLPISEWLLNTIFLSLAVGFSIFFMVITDTEHPPAASVALGLYLSCCNFKAVVVIFIGILLVSVIRKILKPMLKNLV